VGGLFDVSSRSSEPTRNARWSPPNPGVNQNARDSKAKVSDHYQPMNPREHIECRYARNQQSDTQDERPIVTQVHCHNTRSLNTNKDQPRFQLHAAAPPLLCFLLHHNQFLHNPSPQQRFPERMLADGWRNIAIALIDRDLGF
jgi:hypothetical protein